MVPNPLATDLELVDFVKTIKPEIPAFKSDYSYICYITLYQFGAQFCHQKIVLDAACGLGFGSYFLSQVARQVIGVDLVKDKIDFAFNRYKNQNLSFLVTDATQTGFMDCTFDVIVSIETFEHIVPEKTLTFLRELKRLLKPGGQLIISTPNREINHQITHTSDHVSEMSVDQFFSLLAQVFKRYDPYYQRKGVLKSMRTFYSIVRTDRFKLRHIIPKSIRKEINRFIAPQLHDKVPELLNKLKVYKALDINELKDAVIQIAVCQN